MCNKMREWINEWSSKPFNLDIMLKKKTPAVPVQINKLIENDLNTNDDIIFYPSIGKLNACTKYKMAKFRSISL